MNRPPVALMASALLLCPIFAALPDDTTLTQTVWASLLSAVVISGILLAVVSQRREARQGRPRPWSPSTVAFAALLGLALLSLIGRLLAHGTAYLGMMLRGWAVLATEFALFALCRRFARTSRGALYALVGAAVAGSTALSSIGVNEYLLHFVAHEANWRVFATSTPDFLAGYLVLLLPVTLALFLGAPSEKRLPVLFGLVIVLQTGTLLTTGSRFALVSVLVAFAVFAGTLVFAVRHGLTLDAALRRRIVGIALVVVLAGLVAARPILNRLHGGAAQNNSGAFRAWTWRGAARMAVSNPVLGAGVGTWIDTYPRYALTGFTRLAHNSYLQMADECGLPALFALVAMLGLVGGAGARGLKTPLVTPTSPPRAPAAPALKPSKRGRTHAPPTAAPSAPADPLAFVAPADDRLLLCGLLASFAAGVVQNLIDSDWYVFFIGITFWSVAGLAVGTAERGETPASEAAPPIVGIIKRRGWPLLAALGAAVLLLLFAIQGIAARFGYQAQIADDPGDARRNYQAAQAWDPLNARYPAELGARVEARVGSPATAVLLLRRATRLEPNSTNFRRLGTVLDAEGRHAEAIQAYQDGLRVDPNSLDLLLALAADSPQGAALEVYRRVAALEDGPVGRVRAIGEITEARFAIADAALASPAAGGSAQQAVFYGERARRLLEAYIGEGGTLNPERQAQTGNHASPAQDAQFRELYRQVMTRLVAAAPLDRRAALESRSRNGLARFQAITALATGDTAPTPTEAAADYQRAATGLEKYATDTPPSSAPDPAADAPMRDLYKRAMDSLLAVSPADARPALQAREQSGLQKLGQAFPTP